MSPADLVRLFVRHRNAANLLMVVMLVLGAVSLSRLNTQFFPDFGIDMVSINVAWPGASAEERIRRAAPEGGAEAGFFLGQLYEHEED